MKKTRKFFQDARKSMTSECYKTEKKDESERGKICKLCDRKFFIKEMVLDSFK